MALRVFFGGDFLAHWATAKLHRFTVTCFFSLFLSSSWFLFLIVLVFGSFPFSLLASPPSPSLLRHQTWALLRSVERALGSINRITGVARAGVYGVCLHWPGPGEGWVNCTLGLPPWLSCCCLSLPLLLPPPSVCLSPPGYRDLSASSSHALPVYL